MAELVVAPDRKSESLASTRTAMIDCDIHNAPQSPESIRKYLPDRWQAHHKKYGMRNYTGSDDDPLLEGCERKEAVEAWILRE